ncbi:RHS repeat-associated core domain-containing protein [Sphingomonas sp. RT2P30]|uniref:RHS repeat domain-containing protein n=1 Tax=Parasphingomonas halimpatiens TaxID=3096162 RepID=UPI002FCAA652
MKLKNNLLALAVTGALLSVAVSAPARAQVQAEVPPVVSQIDDNGIDLVSGKGVIVPLKIAIGPGGPGSLAYSFSTSNEGQDDWLGFITVDSATSTHYSVTIGGGSDVFILTGALGTGTFAQDQGGSGSTLTYNSSTQQFTYTAADGMVGVFAKQLIAGDVLDSVPRILSLTYPAGETLSYSYRRTSDPANLYTLRSIVSNLGYQLRLTWGLDNSNVLHVTSAVAFNMADETCDPNADVCTLVGNWPSMTIDGAYHATDNAGQTASVTLTAQGTAGLQTVTFPSGHQQSLTLTTWTSSGLVTGFSDGVGAWTYSTGVDQFGQGNADSSSPAGLHHHVYFDGASGRPFANLVGGAIATSYHYGSDKRPDNIALVQIDQAVVKYTYDGRGNVTEKRSVSNTPGTPADVVTRAFYPASCTQPKVCNQPIYTIDANNQQTDYTYDSAHGGVLTVTYPADANGIRAQTRYSYIALSANYRNASGVVIAGSPVYRLTSISQCQTSTSCAGTADEVKSTTTYDPNNALLPVSVTKGAGDLSLVATTTMTYSRVGDLLTADGPLPGSDDTTRTYYDVARRAIGSIGPDPDGAGPRLRQAVRTTFSGEQVTSVETGTATSQSDTGMSTFVAAQQVLSDFDAAGHVVKQRVVAGGVIQSLEQYSYASDGLPDCVARRMNPTIFATITAAACTLGTQGSGANDFGPDQITKYGYDSLRRMTSVKNAFGTAVESTQSTVYGNLSMVTAVIDANNNRTSYSYDGFWRISKIQYPVPAQGANTSSTTDFEQFSYDLAGNILSRRLRDGTSVTFSYDHLNRLTTKTPPGTEPATNYTYDLFGRTTLVSQPAIGVSHTMVWDALSELRSETQPFGTMSYQYDQAGRRRLTGWADGFIVNYDHAVTGEVTAIRENGVTSGPGVLATYSYDDFGRRTGITRGNGATTSYGYDSVSRLSSLSHHLSGTGSDFGAGFTYNPANQVASTTRSNDIYAYGGNANMDKPYVVNGLSQATSSNGYAIGYDARGNVTSAAGSTGTSTFGYNSANLVTSASGGTTLHYDALDRLMEYDTSISTRYVHDGQNVASEVSNPSNAIQRRYVYGPGDDEPVVWYEGSGTSDRRWLHADERGSVVAVSDGSGAAIAINSYDEFGVPASGNIGRFQYTGQAWLPELGLYDYKARMYSSRLGRFMQTDPIGYSDGMNPYNYVHGDPINGTDPTGMCDKQVNLIWWHLDWFPNGQFNSDRSFQRPFMMCLDDFAQVDPSPLGNGGLFQYRLLQITQQKVRKPNPKNSKCGKLIMQSQYTKIFGQMGTDLTVNPMFIMATAVQESGWNLSHVYGTNSLSHGKPLNNLFGSTLHGGNNLPYPNVQASARAWESNWGPYLENPPQTIAQYANDLNSNPHHMYNSNPAYPGELARRLGQLQDAAQDCGIQF